MIDLGPPPLVFPKPAIIRPATEDLLRFGADPVAQALLAHRLRRASGGGAVPPATATFLQAATRSQNESTATYASQNFGTAFAGRRIIAGVSGTGGSTTLSSVTIGGVTADIIVQNTTEQCCVGIVIAQLDAGTSGTVAITWSGTQNRSGLALWSVDGLTANAAVDFDSVLNSTAPLGCSTRNNGFVIAAAADGNNAGAYAFTGITERYDAQQGGEGGRHGGGDNTTTGADASISCDFGGASARRVLTIASW